MNEDQCPDCGATVSGGRAGCQALFEEASLRAYSDPLYAATYALALDAYCMQHPDEYCRSAKSYAAHLTRLCCGLEQNGDHKVYEAIQRWLNGAAPVEKPEVPSYRGQLTVANLTRASDVAEYKEIVRAWAESTWEAYAAQHELARNWIKAALRSKEMLKTK